MLAGRNIFGDEYNLAQRAEERRADSLAVNQQLAACVFIWKEAADANRVVEKDFWLAANQSRSRRYPLVKGVRVHCCAIHGALNQDIAESVLVLGPHFSLGWQLNVYRGKH